MSTSTTVSIALASPSTVNKAMLHVREKAQSLVSVLTVRRCQQYGAASNHADIAVSTRAGFRKHARSVPAGGRSALTGQCRMRRRGQALGRCARPPGGILHRAVHAGERSVCSRGRPTVGPAPMPRWAPSIVAPQLFLRPIVRFSADAVKIT